MLVLKLRARRTTKVSTIGQTYHETLVWWFSVLPYPVIGDDVERILACGNPLEAYTAYIRERLYDDKSKPMQSLRYWIEKREAEGYLVEFYSEEANAL